MTSDATRPTPSFRSAGVSHEPAARPAPIPTPLTHRLSPEDPAPAATREATTAIFLRNMRALWRRDPVLALLVDAVEDAERLPVEASRSGAPTARAPMPDGAFTYLHSRVDPEAEAARFAESAVTEEDFCYVVNGFGLGYHLRAIFPRIGPDALLICTEPSVALIATTLSCLDFSEMIASGRFIILTGDDKARLHDRLKPYNTLMMLGTRFVRHPASLRAAEGNHAVMNKLIEEFVTYTRMSVMTLMQNARTTCRNIAMNLVTYVTTPPIDLLRNRFENHAAVVVSAGPSLSNDLDRLAEAKGRAVLCAVQTVLQPLIRRGIMPDFVTSLDFHEMSLKFFEGIDGLRDVHLVAEPKAAHQVIDAYPGPVSLLGNDWARLVIGDELGARGGLPAGATVAHLAFYLAVYLGCNPIILVGQDLAFTGHVFYVPGVEVHRAWRSELNRFHSIEHKEWERIARNGPILRKVKGRDGGELYTDELLFTYLEQFEKDIAAAPCRVINASEGGALIRGTEPLSLREALDRFAQEPIDPSRFAYRQTTAWRDPAKRGATADEIHRRISEIETLALICRELLELLEELKTLTGDPARFNRRLIRVDELRSRVHAQARAYRIISAASQLAEFRRFSADRRIGGEGPDDARRAAKRIDRDIEFITAIRESAEDMRGVLREALQRVEEKRHPA